MDEGEGDGVFEGIVGVVGGVFEESFAVRIGGIFIGGLGLLMVFLLGEFMDYVRRMKICVT